MKAEEALKIVMTRYDKAAQAPAGTGSCCCPSQTPGNVGFAAQHGLYSEEDLRSVPKTAADLSRGCGNPVGFAELAAGETVVDLGCGAGLDAILAAREVAPDGRVIGVDFAPHMLERARQACAEAGVAQLVSLELGALDRLPLADQSADVVISNCVINLCPDKEAVFREAFRVLKPRGRLAFSDVEYSEMPDAEVQSRFVATWAGCLGGAVNEQHYFELIRRAGFGDIRVIARHPLEEAELREMACCPGPEFTPQPEPRDLAAVQGKVVSIKFVAVKRPMT